MKISVSERKTCRLCESNNIELILKLARTPVGDFFISAGHLGEIQETVPLDLLLCTDCGNVQLRNVVNPEVVYGEYTYVSSISLELPGHFRKYAEDVLKRVNPPQGSLVVELGSNEGALLNFFKNKGMRVIGIDPSREIARKATEAGIETLPSFFSAELAKKIKNEHGAASIVIANNVFANIDDVVDMALGVRELLLPDGIFVFESSYLYDVVKKALLDTIFHEHISYLAVKPLETFFRRNGLEMIDAESVNTKGGSLRGTVQLAGGPRKILPSVAVMISSEEELGIDMPGVFGDLAERLESVKSELLSLLGEIKGQGKMIACYGAAVGLTTMMYCFDLSETVSFIVDDNEIKQNTFSPGYHIPVYASQAIYDKKPDYVLILAWRYAKPIMEQHRAFLEQGGHFILPLPVVKVI